MRKYMIFEVGNYDPVIYTEDEIIKEHWNSFSKLKNIRISKKTCIDHWVKTFNAIKI